MNAFGGDRFDENSRSKHHVASLHVSLAIAVAANTNVVPVNSLARKVEATQLRENPNSDYLAVALKAVLQYSTLVSSTLEIARS